MSDALVLAGGGAKGAFGAGALSVLSSPDTKARVGVDVARLVGASAGALNAVYYAAALRAGAEAGAGQRLIELWLDEASIGGAFAFSLGDIVTGVGLSSDAKVLDILRQHVPPNTTDGQAVELSLVVTNLDGEAITIDGAPATTYEHVATFAGPDFDTAASLERVFVAAAASAALPAAFAPVTVDTGHGTFRGLDGGLVDDAPLARAIANPDIGRVFVIAPFPRVRVAPVTMQGLALASHVIDILPEERLVRDLRHAARANQVLSRLPSLVADASERAALLEALGWRPVEIVEIRPDVELPGNAFSGFASQALRQQYVDAGVATARAALAALR